MNKKVNEEFKYIHDEYLLQCICTELKDKTEEKDKEIEKLNNIIDKIENIVYSNISDIYSRISIQEVLDKFKVGD